jgi:hypothetical protein
MVAYEAGGGLVAVRGEEVIDDAHAVLAIDGTQPGQPRECDRADELTQNQSRSNSSSSARASGHCTRDRTVGDSGYDPRPQRLTIGCLPGAIWCRTQRHPGQSGEV